MNIAIKILTVSLLLLGYSLSSQSVSGVYKIDELLTRIKNPDTTYVVNFWATWCKPCIQELPAFDSLLVTTKGTKVKVLLVSLDFKEDMAKKTNPFLVKNAVKAECVILDEINGNDFINKIDEKWSGAIPATLLKHGDKRIFLEKKIQLSELQLKLAELDK